MSNLRFFAKQDEFHNEKAYVKKKYKCKHYSRLMKYNTILTIIQGMDTHYLNKNTCIHNWQNLSKLIFVLQISQVKIIIKIKET